MTNTKHLAGFAAALAVTLPSIESQALTFTGTPAGSWRYSELLVTSPNGTTYFPTSTNEYSSATFQGYVTFEEDSPYGPVITDQAYNLGYQILSTWVLSDADQTLNLAFNGDDGHTLFVDGTFAGGAGFGVAVAASVQLTAHVPRRLELAVYNSGGGWAGYIGLGPWAGYVEANWNKLLEVSPELLMSADGFPLAVTTRSADDGKDVPPALEPAVLRYPNDVVVNMPAFQLRRSSMLLKVTGPASTSLTAFITPGADTGGHEHPLAGRPHGWLSTDPNDFPVYRTESVDDFESSGSVDYSDLSHAFPFSTDSHGVARLYYFAPEVSGSEVVEITTADSSQFTDVTIDIGVGLSSGAPFVPLQSGPSINLAGGRAAHPDNHYGDPALVTALTALASNWFSQYNRDPDSLPSEKLPVNDMSLIYGGVFDINGTWFVDKGEGHKGHRLGLEVDIGDGQSIPQFHPFSPWSSLFERMFTEEGWFTVCPEGGGKFYHLIVCGSGAVAIAIPDPAQVVNWDAVNRIATVRIPIENRGGIDASSVTISRLSATGGATIASALPTPPTDAPIRLPRWFDVNIQTPPGLKAVILSGGGLATGGGSSFLVPSAAGPGGLFFLPVDLRSTTSAPHGSAGPTPAVSSWQLLLSDANQPAVTNGAVIYHGSIVNDTGADIILNGLDLYFTMAAPNGAFTYGLAPEFLNTGGLIPPGGYNGPLFVVNWSNSPTVGAIGNGEFSLTAAPDFDLPPLTGAFSSAFNLQSLTVSRSGTNVLISWPQTGANMALESSDRAGGDSPEWDDVLSPPTLVNGQNAVVVPASASSTFFRLRSQ